MRLPSSLPQRISTSAALATIFTVSPWHTSITQAQRIQGAGASFAAPLYRRYASEIKKTIPELDIRYSSCGTSCGIRRIKQNKVDFGGSDAAMNDRDIAKVRANGRGNVLLVPIAGGAVSVVHNLPNIDNLKLSRVTLAAIFTGAITRWNHPKIQQDNPGIALPNLPITPVVRSDGSGTTLIFTNHLSSISSHFRGLIGRSKKPKWVFKRGRGIRSRGNSGVTRFVRRTRGGIGYVNHAFAIKHNLKTIQLQNGSGDFVAPSLDTANLALRRIAFPSNYRVFISDSKRGYPIVGLTWMVVYEKYASTQKAEAMKQWLNWILTEGQQFNPELQYTSIPTSVLERVLNDINTRITSEPDT